MSIKIDGVSVPENCFRCFASHWYNFGGEVSGFMCGILEGGKIVSNCDGRSKRRDDCPITQEAQK